MKAKTRRYIVFFGTSLLWSAMLYVALMLLLHWDDITTTPKISPSFTISADSTNTANIHASAPSFLSVLAGIYCNIVSKL